MQSQCPTAWRSRTLCNRIIFSELNFQSSAVLLQLLRYGSLIINHYNTTQIQCQVFQNTHNLLNQSDVGDYSLSRKRFRTSIRAIPSKFSPVYGLPALKSRSSIPIPQIASYGLASINSASPVDNK